MSHQLFKQDILFYQRLLKANGFYPFRLDGIWGPKTDAADAAFVQESETIKNIHGGFDPRSESNIITLAPKVQVLSRKFLTIMVGQGLDVRIISGTRTYAEQDTLFRKGRFGNPAPKVTNARGGQSNHNFGLAWDIGLFENGKYITTAGKYRDLANLVIGVLPNLEWGGHWQSFPDVPHYQHTAIAGSVSGVRILFEQGKPYL
jgi:peptidoglycan L-alanyl-D-glutamate endopeptidase CwlK